MAPSWAHEARRVQMICHVYIGYCSDLGQSPSPASSPHSIFSHLLKAAHIIRVYHASLLTRSKAEVYVFVVTVTGNKGFSFGLSFFFLKKEFIHLFIFRERGREGERAGEKHRSVRETAHYSTASRTRPDQGSETQA